VCQIPRPRAARTIPGNREMHDYRERERERERERDRCTAIQPHASLHRVYVTRINTPRIDPTRDFEVALLAARC